MSIPNTNNLKLLRYYEKGLEKCVSGLDEAISRGHFNHYHDAEIKYAASEDRDGIVYAYLDKDDLKFIYGKRCADLKEVRDKIAWLEDLAEETADNMERD